MGQICSSCMDSKGESDKSSAVLLQGGDHADLLVASGDPELTSASQPLQSEAVSLEEKQRQQELDAQEERLKAMRQEQARLELIVSTAGRDMVGVRSMRGNTGYYDQGFAAALAQHLEQTANNTEYTPTLPQACPSENIVQILSRPPWEGIMLGQKGSGLAGCAGENPNTYMDHVAESFLESVVPVKEQLFAGAGPMVENLM